MFNPENHLTPHGPTFTEAWHAQVLAIADAMVQAGHFDAAEWAEALGKALRAAETAGQPDTEETYYTAALSTLEHLSAQKAGITPQAQAHRKADWETAYRTTPHGQPVILPNG